MNSEHQNLSTLSRGIVAFLAAGLLLPFLPITPVEAVEVAPRTRSATIEGLPPVASDRAAPRGDREDDPAQPPTEPSEQQPPAGSDPTPLADAPAARGDEGTESAVTAQTERSDVIEAPLPFSGLGFTGQGAVPAELRWRALTVDGDWTAWSEVGIVDAFDGPDPQLPEAATAAEQAPGWVSDAVWVGAATHVQVDAPGTTVEDLSVTFIDTAGLSESLPERALRRLRSLTTPPPADASMPRPPIITRAQWGANESCASGTMTYAQPHFSVLHHTVTINNYTEAQAAQQVRNIYHWHTACHGSGQGWYDIGYNFIIDRFGRIYEGRRGGMDRGVIGAHAANYNTGSIGIALMGNHNTAVPSAVSLSALNDLLAWKFDVHGIPTSTSSTTVANGSRIPRLVGHRNIRGAYQANPSTTTDCPGQEAYTRMPAMRTRLANTQPPITHTGIPARTTRRVPVQALGLPANARAVVMNVTTANATEETFLSVWPSGTSRPSTSTLNTTPDRLASNEVVVPVGSDGRVNVYNHNGFSDVLLDVVGYLPSTSSYVPVQQRRLIDTRSASGGASPVRAGRTLTVSTTGHGIPTDARGIVVNITAVGATASSYVTAWSGSGSRPETSTLNTDVGLVVPNEVIVGYDSSQRINLYNHRGSTHLLVDLVGYFTSSSSMRALAPRRLLDTRPSTTASLGSAETRSLSVADAGVPTSAAAVIMNVTGMNASTDSYLTVWPHGSTRPRTSTLNLSPGQVKANEVIAPLGSNGRISVYNHRGQTDLVLDVVGFVNSTQDVVGLAPTRIYDTRSGS